MRWILAIILLVLLPNSASAGLTGWSTSNYLHRLSQVVDTYPFGISVWSYVVTTTPGVNSWLCLVGQDGQDNNRRASVFYDTVANALEAQARDTGNSAAQATADIPTDTWFHTAASFVSTTLREVWLDGANFANNTVSRTPGSSDAIKIGIRADTTSPWTSDGGIAEFSVWDLTGFSAANRVSWAGELSSGSNPLNMNAQGGQPWTGKLVAYWIDDNNTLTDLAGNGHDLTEVGTVSDFGGHPTIDALTSGRRPVSPMVFQ